MSDATTAPLKEGPPSFRVSAKPGRPIREAFVWLACLAPFFYVSYGFANWLAGTRGDVPSVVFDWERQLPFWAWTIFPYWTINVFYALSLFLCRSRHELNRHASRLLTAQVGAVGFFIMFPLAFSFGQPPADGAAGWLFAALREFDKPFNQAPSLHIALAVILWDLYRRIVHSGAARWLLHGWTLAICVSVLTSYQHHFVDIPTGALLGLVCLWLWPLERRVPPWKAWRLTLAPDRWRLACLYAAGAVGSFALGLEVGGAALWLAWPAVALLLVAFSYLGVGSRAFGKDLHAGSTWAVKWVTAPHRAGAWLNSRWWTRMQERAVQVAPGLWLGRSPGRGPVAPYASALNLAAELDSPCCVPTLHLPALDLVAPSASWLLRASSAIERQRGRYGSVLVFCALGFSRSAAAVVTWLVVTRRADNVLAAIETVRQARPLIVLGPKYEAAIVAACLRAGVAGASLDGAAA